jgi:hypothetical protein
MSRVRPILPALLVLAAPAVFAQTPPAPLPTPSMAGPLQSAPPNTFNAGPLGTLEINVIVSGIGLVQSNPAPGNATAKADLSNGEIFLQKSSGWFQFYLQAGVYDLPMVGMPFVNTGKTLTDLFGPIPVGYVKLAPRKDFSVLIGVLPSLIGAESPFTFQNMNIERGLLWNQENNVNRGLQVNETIGRLTASLSWNDGYYSNRYSWLSGSLTYAFNPANSLAFTAGGNLGATAFRNLATPVQNNGGIYDVVYTYTKGHWVVQPYFQFNIVPANQAVGIAQGASATGGAVLVTYNFPHHFSLAARAESLTTTGTPAGAAVNLLYGPGSAAWSATLTPTFQDHAFFLRGEFSFAGARSVTPGYAFGNLGLSHSQARGVIETGFLF